jgi:hypothetical protein
MMKTIIAVIGLAISIVLAYGFWYVSTHGWLNMQIRDISEQNYQTVKDAEITFRDSDGNVFAEGKSDHIYGVVYLKHPEAGYCVEQESQTPYSQKDRERWRTCYEKQSKWIIGWAGKVKYVDLKFDACSLKQVPVSVVASKGDWWLWWVPLPHQGGKPVTSFYINIRVDRPNCILPAA